MGINPYTSDQVTVTFVIISNDSSGDRKLKVKGGNLKQSMAMNDIAFKAIPSRHTTPKRRRITSMRHDDVASGGNMTTL